MREVCQRVWADDESAHAYPRRKRKGLGMPDIDTADIFEAELGVLAARQARKADLFHD